MNRDQVIATLREHAADLQRGGIRHLHLFGSVARGTAVQNQSDVDLIAEFDGTMRLSLFDKAGLEVELGELLNTRVDLSDREMLREQVRVTAEREAILVF